MNRNPCHLVFLISLVIGSFGLLFDVARAASDCENVPGWVIVQAASLRVRSGPGTTYDTLRFVGRDDILPVLDAEAASGWWRVCPEGFVSAAYVRFEAAPPTAIPATSTTPRATPTQIQTNLVWCSSEPEVRRIGESWIVECER